MKDQGFIRRPVYSAVTQCTENTVICQGLQQEIRVSTVFWARCANQDAKCNAVSSYEYENKLQQQTNQFIK